MENGAVFSARVVKRTTEIDENLNFQVPDALYQMDEAKDIVNSDREMVSKLVGLYSFAFGVLPLMRYTAALNTTVQSLLVKGKRMDKYRDVFRAIDKQWEAARVAMQNELDYDIATCAFMRIELALKIIAERENLTMHRQEYFDGRFMTQAETVAKEKVEQDPFAR